MSLEQRLRQLEGAHTERLLRKAAERLAKEHRLAVDEALQEMRESYERIRRWGIDAELRHFGAEHGLSDDEVRARYEKARREIEAEER